MTGTVEHVTTHGVDAANSLIGANWERIEAEYRAGLLSLRAIAAKDGRVTEGAIRKRARKLEWSRDLSARIRSKAAELVVAATVRAPSPQYATGNEAAETAIVDDHAHVLAQVTVTQRRNISRASTIVAALFYELERTAGDRTTQVILDPLGVRDDDGAVHRAHGTTANRGVSLSTKAATVKSLCDALRTLVALERQAWGMDTGGPDPANARPVIDSSKLTFDERQQLRAMILRASSPSEPSIADQSGE